MKYLFYPFLLFFIQSFGQDSLITLENIFQKNIFKTSPPSNLTFINSGKNYLKYQDSIVSIYNTESNTLINSINVHAIFDDFITDDNLNYFILKYNTEQIYRYSTKSKCILFNKKNDYNQRLDDTLIEHVNLSPKNKFISYIKNNNLFIYDLNTLITEQITYDGELNKIINGKSDWVYEEELNLLKAYWWNESSNKIAYLKFDESEVSNHTLQYFNKTSKTENYTYKYPLAGENGSKVSIWIYDVASKKHSKITTNTDFCYLPRLFWKNDSTIIYYQLNRFQNDFKIIEANTNLSQIIYQETSNTYLELDNEIIFNSPNLYFTTDKSGYKHIIEFNIYTKKYKQITRGQWDVSEISGITKNFIIYKSNESKTENQLVYLFNLKSKKSTSIYKSGFDQINNISENYILLTHSTLTTEPINVKVNLQKLNIDTLNKTTNPNIHKLTQSVITKFENYAFSNYKIQTLQIRTKDTTSKPNGLLVYQYSGPGFQAALNQWKYSYMAWFCYLAQKGIHVLIIDPRGSGGKGKDFQKCTYLNLGQIESHDIYETTKAYAKKYFIDTTQITIFGWSFGGYTSLMCSKNYSLLFKKAIAVAPVTDWTLYDNIYTERYMQTPLTNKIGYLNSSILTNTEQINNNILLIHGTADDNVHISNSYQLQNKLMLLNKKLDFEVFADKNHGIYGGNTRYYLFKKISDFIVNAK